MGFEPEPTTIKLSFSESPDLAGLEVTMKSITVQMYNKILAQALLKGEEGIKASLEVHDLFCSKLVSWNVTSDGKPVPATQKGIESQESNFIVRIIAAWQIALTTVPTTSSSASKNGARRSHSQESALGLDAQSRSPGN